MGVVNSISSGIKSMLGLSSKGEQRAAVRVGQLGPENQFIAGSGDVFANDDDLPTVQRVAGYPPVSQAIQMIAGDCAKLPAKVFQRYAVDGGEDRYERPKHYAAKLIDLFGQPNETDTTFDVLFDWFFDALLFGGGYCWIERQGAKPVAIHKLLPDRTQPVYYGSKRYFQTHVWDATDNTYPAIYYANDDVLYLQGINVASLAPSNPIRLYCDTFRQAINAADFTSSYFKSGTQAGGLLISPPGAGTTAIDNVEAQVKARAKKENWFKTLVLKDGFRWQSTTGSLRDATTVELDESSARHVARIYNLPPSKLGLSDTVSYNSLEQENRQYYASCLSTWLIQARSQFHRKLIVPSEQADYVVDYDIDDLNWADAAVKAEVFSKLITNQVMDTNEVRRKYNMAPRKITTPTPPPSTRSRNRKRGAA